jgi:hypothetical protein
MNAKPDTVTTISMSELVEIITVSYNEGVSSEDPSVDELKSLINDLVKYVYERV